MLQKMVTYALKECTYFRDEVLVVLHIPLSLTWLQVRIYNCKANCTSVITPNSKKLFFLAFFIYSL